MPQLPGVGATGWGTTLNTFLATAHDNTSGANGGKIKPAGIIAGTTGQVLTTNAEGVPTWGSANYLPKYGLYNSNVKVQTYSGPIADGSTNSTKFEIKSSAILPPTNFNYIMGYGFGIGIDSDMSNKQGEVRTTFWMKDKTDTWTNGNGTTPAMETGSTNGTIFRLGAGFGIWTPNGNGTITGFNYHEMVPKVILPIDVTNADLRIQVSASNTKSNANCYIQIIWWNGQ